MATIDDRLAHLDELAQLLEDAGLTATVQRTGEPCMHVASTALPGVTEKILCILGDDEWLWFTWEWRRPITPAADPAGAARVIASVFRPVLGACG